MKNNSTSCRALLFDMDGTLVKFRFKVKESRRALIEMLRVMQFDTSEFSEELPTQLIYDRARQQVATGRISRDFGGVKKTLGGILDQFEMDAFSESELMPSAVEVLARLKSRGFKMGLVTNDGRFSADLILGRHDLGRFFEVVVTRDDVDRMKPNPEGVLKALKALGAEPYEAIFIGDSVLDVQAAAEAGVTMVSVVGGVHSSERLVKASPDYLIPTLSGVFDVIQEINGRDR